MNTLTEQDERGIYAREALQDADIMQAALRAWDELRHSEKLAESEKGTRSRFFFVPGFQPRWCGYCLEDVFPDYREDPEGFCPIGQHYLDEAPEAAAA